MLQRSVPSHCRPVLVALLHSKGLSQVLERMAGADDLGTGGYLADSQWVARVGIPWVGGRFRHVPILLEGVEFGFLALLFLHLLKQKNLMHLPSIRLCPMAAAL